MDFLEADFTEEEVKVAVFGSYGDGALAPMAFLSSSTRPFGRLLKKT